ncbi:hypothetical protein CLU85_0833 [Acidovorax sp. 69]|nr:hypothetical protein CLU85_0833 [Acidovorax sp. 69]
MMMIAIIKLRGMYPAHLRSARVLRSFCVSRGESMKMMKNNGQSAKLWPGVRGDEGVAA